MEATKETSYNCGRFRFSDSASVISNHPRADRAFPEAICLLRGWREKKRVGFYYCVSRRWAVRRTHYGCLRYCCAVDKLMPGKDSGTDVWYPNWTKTRKTFKRTRM